MCCAWTKQTRLLYLFLKHVQQSISMNLPKLFLLHVIKIVIIYYTTEKFQLKVQSHI